MISLILGLGNIGERYQGSRHNLGFEVIGQVAVSFGKGFDITEKHYCAAVKNIDDRQVVIAQPSTNVNLSGQSAFALLQDYSMCPTDLLVVVDDFNLPLGSLRIRNSGSDGGHNGLESIIQELETDRFPRMRLGIGPLPEGMTASDFVLRRFLQEEIIQVKKMIKIAAKATIFSITHCLEETMNKYNINPA